MAKQVPAGKRLPPISDISPRKTASTTTIPVVNSLPAVICRRDFTVRPQKSPTDYLDLDLNTPRLNDIHQHLWLAGSPTAARPLHKQKQLGRSLLITEDPDEHLVWFETQLFVKPLPQYLLDHDWWVKHLCEKEDLYRSACGLLFSYAWLVCYPCDLDIAKDTGLLPHDICWLDWVRFIETFLDSLDLGTLNSMNRRYQYGELRLSRLNGIYRFIPPAYSLRRFVRGYRSGSTWYAVYFGGYSDGCWLYLLSSLLLSLRCTSVWPLQIYRATAGLETDRMASQ